MHGVVVSQESTPFGSSTMQLQTAPLGCLPLLPFDLSCRTKMTRKNDWPTMENLLFFFWCSHFPPAGRSLGWDLFHFPLQVRVAGVDINTKS